MFTWLNRKWYNEVAYIKYNSSALRMICVDVLKRANFPVLFEREGKKLLKIFFSFWKIRYYVEEIFTSQPNIVALSKFQVCKRRITDNTHPTDIKPKNEWLLQKFGNVFITALDKTIWKQTQVFVMYGPLNSLRIVLNSRLSVNLSSSQ